MATGAKYIKRVPNRSTGGADSATDYALTLRAEQGDASMKARPERRRGMVTGEPVWERWRRQRQSFTSRAIRVAMRFRGQKPMMEIGNCATRAGMSSPLVAAFTAAIDVERGYRTASAGGRRRKFVSRSRGGPRAPSRA
jgi:hypothetical protein